MSIQPIDHGHTRGLQIKVFRAKSVKTKFLAYKKHGGEEATWALARLLETQMEIAAGPRSPSRNKNDHADKPNRNSTSGIPGIRAFILEKKGRKPVLQFSSSWIVGEPGERNTERIQRSSAAHGILGALGDVLEARERGSGIKMPSPRKAWKIIKEKLAL